MSIQAVSPVSFKADKKFRLPADVVSYDRCGTLITNIRHFSGNYVKEYSNPQAEVLYNEAQKAKDWREKARLYSEMGNYELVDISLKAKIKMKLQNFLSKRLP